jgi:hypothetical protein
MLSVIKTMCFIMIEHLSGNLVVDSSLHKTMQKPKIAEHLLPS